MFGKVKKNRMSVDNFKALVHKELVFDCCPTKSKGKFVYRCFLEGVEVKRISLEITCACVDLFT